VSSRRLSARKSLNTTFSLLRLRRPDHSSAWTAFRAGAGGGALMAVATATKFSSPRWGEPSPASKKTSA
jgi:hypothetical protein